MQRIQMQVSRKQKSFSHFFAAFLKATLNFEHFQKKDYRHTCRISEIMDSEKPGQINFEKVPFQGILWKATWKTRPNIVEICMAGPLPYLLITVNATDSQKVSVSETQNLMTVS